MQIQIQEAVNQIMSAVASNQVNVPLLQPILDLVAQIPMAGFLVSFVLWKPFFAALICPGLSTLGILLLVFPWVERKLCGRIQWRVGPHEIVWWLGGLPQIMADSVKFLFQEVIVHKDADRPYYLQFPFLSFIAALLPLLFISAGNIIAIETPYAIQLMLALICLFPLFILGLGWASNNRFSFIGTVREAFMSFAYEIPFIIAVLAMIVLYGTSNPLQMSSTGGLLEWGLFRNPVAAFTFFVAAAMATSRLPFEIAEAEQELAAGPHVEYSGISFGLIYVMCYEKAYILSGLMTILFLGGGSGPAISGLGDLSGAVWFLAKTVVVMTTLFALRTIYPRYRLDQGLKIGWGAMISLSLVALALSVVIVLVQGGIGGVGGVV
ncbi:NADH-quinone oxidoreductase subunit H [ANME-1 cluster archaeon ex4572_4]|nr:MAG: NADH-quinone oxidoreductase subunit H [ANME-1 cluster archaeon ex4572_4]